MCSLPVFSSILIATLVSIVHGQYQYPPHDRPTYDRPYPNNNPYNPDNHFGRYIGPPAGDSLSISRFSELVSRLCPRAQNDVDYNECRSEVFTDWETTRDPMKLMCCRHHDDINCLRRSVKRSCSSDVLEQFDDYLNTHENELRYGQRCREYYKWSKCHFPIWAYITIAVVSVVVVFVIIATIFFVKCRR